MAQKPAAELARDAQRPQLHLMPPGNWMNDPNGPVFWRGAYHLFYQVNPRGATWGDISWAHAVSHDLLHWTGLPIVMEPQVDTPWSYGVFSGSCEIDGSGAGERCLAFYTAVEPGTKDNYTLADTGARELYREQQCVAVSTDPKLLTFAQQVKPVISAPPVTPSAGFRDPQVWREGSTWYMVLGSGKRAQRNDPGYGCAVVYKATTPDGPNSDWSYVGEMLSAPSNGRMLPNTVDTANMWECPDFFRLDGHDVLLYSTERKTFWVTGKLGAGMKLDVKRSGQLDTGAFYAPKSQLAPLPGAAAASRILWGWIPEKRSDAEMTRAGWSGCMALPRVLSVDADGVLRSRTVPAVESLMTGPVLPCKPAAKLPSLTARVTIDPGSTGLLRLEAQPGESLLVVSIDATQLFLNGARLLRAAGTPVQIYVDGSVIEVFQGDVAAHTLRSYPRMSPGDGLHCITDTPQTMYASVQAMKPVSADRFTS